MDEKHKADDVIHLNDLEFDDEDEEFKVPITREVQPMMVNKSRVSGHHIQVSDSNITKHKVKELSNSFSSLNIDKGDEN